MSRLSDIQAQTVVDGILAGYKNYLQERREKRLSMKVSYGYAFTKGNHIDDAVVNRLENMIEKTTLEKVKGGWEHFEYTFKNGVSCFFIIKNASRVRTATKKGSNESSYLIEYAALLNNNWIEEERLRDNQQKEDDMVIQLSMLTEEEKKKLDERRQVREHDRFYLVIYETNELKMITRIELVALDAVTRELHQIQDLSPYIQTSDVEVTEAEASVVLGDSEIEFSEEYGYTVPAAKEEKNKSN